jgi:hypothetical protein
MSTFENNETIIPIENKNIQEKYIPTVNECLT